MARGELEVLGLLQGASNYSLLARLHPAERLVVYKPRRGETPLWDFPPGTLCNREVAAWVVSAAAGWDLVPLTIMRDGPYGEGSVQVFHDHDPSVTAFDLIGSRDLDLQRIVLLDLVINNADRKAGHVFVDEGGVVRAIDHGVCFAEEPKLRTVLWDWVGERVPASLRDEVRMLCDRVSAGDLDAELRRLLSPAELATLHARSQRVAGMEVFPAPGPGRPYPWPVI